MIYIETGSDDVYYNFGLEYYFTLEKQLPDTFKEKMVRHIMKGSSNTYVPTPEDIARIKQLGEEHFHSWDSIYGANPRFNIERTGRFAGGKIQFKIDVRKSTIEDISVFGDFFSTVDADSIKNALKGCRYEQEAVLTALRAHNLDGAIYRISAEEMAKTIVD